MRFTLPIQPPRPSYFRWQKFTSKAKLPAELRDKEQIPALDPGESYFLALGGTYGWSGGSLRYKHSIAGVPEIALGDLPEGGLKFYAEFLFSQEHFNVEHAMLHEFCIHVELGQYVTQPDGSTKWSPKLKRSGISPNGLTSVTFLETECVGATHARIIEAWAMPTTVAFAVSSPIIEPAFVCPLCVVEIE